PVFELYPGANAVATFSIPAFRWLIGRFGKPEISFIEQGKPVAQKEDSTMLPRLFAVITTHSVILILRNCLSDIFQLILIPFLRAEEVELVETNQRRNHRRAARPQIT